jgi:hypothetical protein
LQRFPCRQANATEPERTLNLAILATESGAEPGFGELLCDPLTRFLGQAGVDLRREARVRVPREHGRLWERQTVLECEPDECMPQIAEADALATIIQPGPVARGCSQSGAAQRGSRRSGQCPAARGLWRPKSSAGSVASGRPARAFARSPTA